MGLSTTLGSASTSFPHTTSSHLTKPRDSFDADVLLCADGQTDGCLTADQLTSVKKAYSDYYEGDEYVFGRYFPAGGEAALAFGLLSSAPFELALDYYRYFFLKYVHAVQSRRGMAGADGHNQ